MHRRKHDRTVIVSLPDKHPCSSRQHSHRLEQRKGCSCRKDFLDVMLPPMNVKNMSKALISSSSASTLEWIILLIRGSILHERLRRVFAGHGWPELVLITSRPYSRRSKDSPLKLDRLIFLWKTNVHVTGSWWLANLNWDSGLILCQIKIALPLNLIKTRSRSPLVLIDSTSPNRSKPAHNVDWEDLTFK